MVIACPGEALAVTSVVLLLRCTASTRPPRRVAAGTGSRLPCFSPLTGWRSRVAASQVTGKRPLTFAYREGFGDLHQVIPCGVCLGCRQSQASQWAVRCFHESLMWQNNVFATLTYRDEDLPLVAGVPTLRPRDMVLFLKRLRKLKGGGVRFFQAGEYGSRRGRPHHHVILFNCWFDDAYPIQTRKRYGQWRSATLESLWPHGLSSFGLANYETAAYAGKYLTKLSVREDGKPYRVYSPGQVHEYKTMSRRPGLGRSFMDKYLSSVFPEDKVTLVGGFKVKPPRYYDDLLKRLDPVLAAKLRAARLAAIVPSESGSQRLLARQETLRGRITRNRGSL